MDNVTDLTYFVKMRVFPTKQNSSGNSGFFNIQVDYEYCRLSAKLDECLSGLGLSPRPKLEWVEAEHHDIQENQQEVWSARSGIFLGVYCVR